MKKYFLMAIMMMACVMGAQAQDACRLDSAKVISQSMDKTTGEISIVAKVSTNAEDTYRWAREFLATTVKGYQQSVKVEDKETGTVKCDGRVFCRLTSRTQTGGIVEDMGHWEFVLTVACKDGRFRLKAENVRSNMEETLSLGGMQMKNGIKKERYEFLAGFMNDPKAEVYLWNGVANIVEDMVNYIEKQSKEDDF